MQVRVLFFGILKDLAGRSSDVLNLPEQATAGDVLDHYEREISSLRGKLASIAVSVNQEYASPDDPLRSGDEIALLPPVSGGGDSEPYVAIVREKIDSQGIISRTKAPTDGAVIAFEGIVRDQTRGRKTLFLEYEAYEVMALKEIRELARQALTRFEVRDVALVHRLGRVEISESSVLIVVASAHRAAAFEACRWLIDTLKRTVPIWKKEFFEDGAVWADGEPFPDSLAAHNSRSSASK